MHEREKSRTSSYGGFCWQEGKGRGKVTTWLLVTTRPSHLPQLTLRRSFKVSTLVKGHYMITTSVMRFTQQKAPCIEKFKAEKPNQEEETVWIRVRSAVRAGRPSFMGDRRMRWAGPIKEKGSLSGLRVTVKAGRPSR
ncbi:hypothetical protein SAY87_020707 [Trapa incisa]|uniref:Uncharacterized protein n=1 Tax=Trapa incisa TaxID=236973 RepID=A0AAN7PPQ4_9MYRT|nr:hypothetical protein SAY87_020707 [Trapa incisa]